MALAHGSLGHLPYEREGSGHNALLKPVGPQGRAKVGGQLAQVPITRLLEHQPLVADEANKACPAWGPHALCGRNEPDSPVGKPVEPVEARLQPFRIGGIGDAGM